MSNLVIQAPTPAAAETPIKSSEFWPDIDPAKVRDDQRIDNTVTPPRLRHALVEAIATTNHALLKWRSAQQAGGFAKLDDVPADTVDDVSVLTQRYQRAVGCLAKALLLERYRDIDTTAKGDKKADTLTDPIDDLRRDHQNALADITGRTRSTVELI
jgi:hypothetical protein